MSNTISSALGPQKKVILIGGAGYIGPVIAEQLLENGHDVTIFDNFLYRQFSSVTHLFGRTGFSFIRGDLCDRDRLGRAVDGHDHAVILAGLVGDPITKRYPVLSQRINGQGIRSTIDLLDGLGLDRVVFISTCSNYGLMPDGQVATECTDLRPLSLYAEEKVRAEGHFLKKRDRVDYVGTILRFATAYGLAPRMRFDLTVNEFTRDLALGKELVVYDPDTWRPYCHVKDFGRLVLQVLGANKDAVNFEVFNAGGESNNFTKRMLVEAIASYTSVDRVEFLQGGQDPRNYFVDFSKVRDVLGFAPRYSVSDGIKETLDAIASGTFDGVDSNRNFYGNYEIVAQNEASSSQGAPSWREPVID